MARTNISPDTAPSAAHAAPDPAPAPGTAPAADSPAAAVHAALAASPGSAVTAIADAAGTGKPATRAALLAMEKTGTATRVKGTKPGIPDTWTLAGPAPDGTSPPQAPEAGQPAQPDQDAGGSPDGAAGDETADSTGQGSPAEAGEDPGPHDGGEPEAGTSTAPGPETEQPGSRDDDAPADAGHEDAGHEDAAPDERNDDETATDSSGENPDGSDEPGGEDAASADGDGDGDAGGDAQDPALLTDLIERLDQVRAAADAAELVLTASGDLKTVLAGLDEIYEQAAEARRSLKAAIGGRRAPAVRPGGLRDKVLAHLDAHPDAEFTPHEIHKVLNHSSGAIANALETLVKLGDAEVATEKPRRFRRAAQPAETAPGAAGAGSPEDSAELAGAA
jgi:hypothetical protein